MFFNNEFFLKFDFPYSKIVDLTDFTSPNWLPDAKLNITSSCFLAKPSTLAIIYQTISGEIIKLSYKELDNLSNRIANGLRELNFQKGDSIAINMPMTTTTVAIYLGIIKAGCVVVSIADSFAPEEISTRPSINMIKLLSVPPSSIMISSFGDILFIARVPL